MSCVTCGKKRSTFQCVCSTIYCSQDCQKENWSIHKGRCNELKLLSGQFEEGEFTDLNWVRGTNSSIFLSCYQEGGKWFLMAKGEQFRRGFVPMRETIDSGIISFAGINFQSISAYHPSHMEGSGAYANRTEPYDHVDPWRKMREYIKQKVCYAASPIEICYWMMRTKQYYGDSEDTIHLASIHKKSACYKEHLEKFATSRAYFASIIRLLDAHISLPPDFDAVVTAFEKREDWSGRRSYVLNLENEIRRQLDLPMAYGLDMRFYSQQVMEDFITTKRVSEFMRYVGSPGNTELVPRLITAKLFGGELFDGLREEIRELVLVFEGNIAVVQNLYNVALSDADPVFTLTEFDKAIVEDPIPLVIASTQTHGRPTDVRSPEEELALPAIVEIGVEGADVVYVKSKDERRLVRLLAQLDPPPILTIRVNNEVFQ